MRVLFVCTANLCRSRMAEEVFRVLAWTTGGRRVHDVRSAGTAPDGDGRALTDDDLAWADVVCAMEAEHAAVIRLRWPEFAPKVRVLDVPDVYRPDDPELKDVLTRHVLALLSDAVV